MDGAECIAYHFAVMMTVSTVLRWLEQWYDNALQYTRTSRDNGDLLIGCINTNTDNVDSNSNSSNSSNSSTHRQQQQQQKQQQQQQQVNQSRVLLFNILPK